MNASYQNKHIKYKLTNEELSMIDATFKFLKIFKNKFALIRDYRTHLITTIRNNYTPEQFLQYEIIINKLFWNLRYIVSELWLNRKINGELPYSLTYCSTISYDNNNDLKNKLLLLKTSDNITYRSALNKLIMVDKKQHIIYSKQMEGSDILLSNNGFNCLTFTILFKRQLYEQVITTRKLPDKLKVYKCNISLDYGFPNMNVCVYNVWDDNEMLERIKKMYYEDNDKYWCKLMV